MCSQPRRISAITISERVAAERGERIGENVGYKIRLESRLLSSSLFWLKAKPYPKSRSVKQGKSQIMQNIPRGIYDRLQ